MSYLKDMKEIARLLDEIADVLAINPDIINLSQVSGGWMADVYSSNQRIQSETLENPTRAMEDLLSKAQRSRNK
jgi:hypothetical protein